MLNQYCAFAALLWFTSFLSFLRADDDDLDFAITKLTQSSYTSQDLTDEGWVIKQTTSGQPDLAPNPYYCSSGYSSFNGKYFLGPYKNDVKPQVSFSGLPPHFEYYLSLDVIFLGDYNKQLFKVYDDASTPNTIVSASFPDINNPGFTNGQTYCNSIGGSSFYQMLDKGKHSDNTLTIIFEGANTSIEYIVRNIQLSLNRCHFSCSACSGPYSTDCTSCPLGPATGGTCSCSFGYAYDNDCVATCPGNLFADPDTSTCIDLPCGPQCQTCDSVKKICQQCTGGYFLHQGYCVSQCPVYAPLTGSMCTGPIDDPNVKEGQYMLKGLFTDIFSNYEIERMFNPHFTTCGSYRVLGGWATYGVDTDITITIANIPPHHTIHIQFKYLIVDDNANTNYYLNLDTKQIGKFQNYSPQGTSDICGRTNKDKYEAYSQQFTHDSTPAVFQFFSSESVNFYSSFGIRELIIYVQKCTANCISCTDTVCKKCEANYYLYNNACTLTCPSSYYKSSVDPPSCQKCHSTCKECFGDQIDNCTKCFNSDFLKEKQCVAACLDSYYEVYSPIFQCLKCDKTCFNCTGPSNKECKNCTSPLFYTSKKCVVPQKCPIGTYPESSSWNCSDCHGSCVTCTGPANNQCSSCNFYLSNGTCFEVCDPGYFGNDAKKICEKCSNQCTECKTVRTNCTKCTGSLYLTGTTCDPNCPIGYYPVKSASGNICTQCDSKCQSCEGAGPNLCTSCNPGTYLTSKKTCDPSCGANEYQDEQRRACRSCFANCTTCKGPNFNDCITCTDPYYRTPDFTCDTQCPTYYYPDKASQFCKECHTTCLTCSGKDQNQCLKCDLGRYLHEGYCKITCPEEFFENNITQTCDPCYQSCKTCTGAQENQCIGCKSGLYFYKNKCLDKCDNGTWPNKQSMRCSNCDLSCQTCSGGSVNQCLTCQISRYFFNGQCISNCPEGFFTDQSTSNCVSCDKSCKTCFERNSNQCETCFSDKFLNIETHICVDKCPSGQYGNQAESSLCQVCQASCLECTGKAAENCTSCPNNRYFVNNSCLANCPAGFFEVKTSNICQACYETCSHCISTSKSGCIDCKDGFYFYNNQCLAVCPDGYFGNKISGTCDICDASCKTCSNKYTNNCTSCHDTFYLLKGICISNCPSRYSQIGDGKNVCLECNESCLTCSISNPNVCLTCAQGWYLLNTQCLRKCPLYYYSDSIQNKCVPCPLTCEICSNPERSLDSCIQYERNLAYTDFLMFWIFIAIMIFSIIALLVGFYLDTIIPNRQKIKSTQYRSNKFQIHPEPLLTDHQLPSQQKNGLVKPGESPEYINGKRKVSRQLNQIEELDSYEGDPKKKDKIIFSNDEPVNNPKKKHQYDPNVDPPTQKYKITKSGVMQRFDGDIRHKSDKEVLNIIIPQSKVLNINKHLKENDMLSNDGAQGPISLAYIQEDEEKRKKKPGNSYDDDSSSVTSNKLRQGNASLTYSSAMLQNKNNKNNTTQASIWQDNSEKGAKEKPRSFARTFVEFFEMTSIVVRYNENLSRPLRVMLFFCKFIFLIYVTSPSLNLKVIFIMMILVAVKMFMNGATFFLTKLSQFYTKLTYIFFAILFLYVVFNNTYQFFPQLDWISLSQDRSWALIFAIVVAADFIIIQGLFIALQYFITRYVTFSDSYTCPQKFLSIFCFEKKISEFITTK